MNLGHHNSFHFLSSSFTRKKGYVGIKSSRRISHKDAISILNSFTPQGASPKHSVRVSNYQGRIGTGFYAMIDPETAFISTLLHEFQSITMVHLPNSNELIENIALGDPKQYFSLTNPVSDAMLHDFGEEKMSAIIYSLLSGDNIIIVHPSHEVRLEFLAQIVRWLPPILFSYNRITSDCYELDGNENVIGVSELPSKFRSYKKLYLPLDTIFVDLAAGTIQGEGIKKSEYTNYLASQLISSPHQVYTEICKFMEQIQNGKFKFAKLKSTPTQALVSVIQRKMGLAQSESEDWMMAF